MPDIDGIRPDWPAPSAVTAFQTVRATGPLDTLENALELPSAPSWLEQVHGTEVAAPRAGQTGLVADAAVTRTPGVVLAVRTADCLPVILCDRDGSVIAVAHAGWRGLAAGVLEATVGAMAIDGADLLAWFGPAIGKSAFEVGPEVRSAFLAHDARAAEAFTQGRDDRWHADLETLARQRLGSTGVTAIHGGGRCTVSDPVRFHSYRRDGGTGRMATLVWMEAQ